MQYTKMLQESLKVPENIPMYFDVLNLTTKKTTFGLTAGGCGTLMGSGAYALKYRFSYDPKPVFLQMGNFLIRTSLGNVTWPENLDDKRIVSVRKLRDKETGSEKAVFSD